jgi:hypothetical protein
MPLILQHSCRKYALEYVENRTPVLLWTQNRHMLHYSGGESCLCRDVIRVVDRGVVLREERGC